jgi:hypothetical protein
MKHRLECEICGKEFSSRHKSTPRFCSIPCRAEHQKQGLASGTAGALGELVVCTDLLRKGYSVYRSVSPHASCDLIITKGLDTVRVEVKTLSNSWSLNNCLKHAMINNKFDVLAVVCGENIVYLLEDGSVKEM